MYILPFISQLWFNFPHKNN